MRSQLFAHSALLLATLIYGANYTIAKEVLDFNYIQPVAFVVIRAFTGLLLFSLFHQLFIRENVDRKDLIALLICGIFGVAINQSFFFLGLKLTKPIHASLIMTFIPMIVLIISFIYLKERVTKSKILGIITGAVGVILLIFQGATGVGGSNIALGDFLIFINACSYSMYLVLVKRLLTKYHPVTVIKWIFLFGFIAVLPFGIQDLLIIDYTTFNSTIWWAIIYVCLCTTFIAYLCNVYALKLVSPTTVSIYIYVQPIFASIIAIAMLRDHLDLVKIIAGVLIFYGVYLVSRLQSVK